MQNEVPADRLAPSLGQLSHLAADIVVTNTTWPLRAVSNAAIATSGLALLFLAYVVVVFLAKDDVAEGWATKESW